MKRDGGHHEMQQPVSPKIAILYADRPSGVSSRFFVQTGHETPYLSSGNHLFSLYQVIVRLILDRPNCFGQVKIVLVESKSFWSGSK
jgi:hypothetical protein